MKNSVMRLGIWLSFLISLGLLSGCEDGATAGPPNPTQAVSSGTSSVALVQGSNGMDNSVIRIYFSLPLSSDINLFTSYKRAGQMALDEQTGGTGKIGQYNIDYVVVDDASPTDSQWNPALERASATRAAADPDAMIYLGPVNSGAAKIAIPILNQAGIAVISPGATYPGLTFASAGITRAEEPDLYYPTKVRNFFRVAAPDNLQTSVISDYFTRTAVKKVYIIDDSQLYGRGLADGLTLDCNRHSLDCSHRSSITGKEANYEALAASIKVVNPDFIFFAGITQQQAPRLIKDIRAAGLKMPFMGGGALRYDLFIEQAGPDAEGVMAINSGTPEDSAPPKGQDFLKRYRATYGETGLNQAFTRQAYDCMNLALTAVKQSGKNRKGIIKSLANLKNFEGALGTYQFDSNGDITLPDFTLWQVKIGRWQPSQVLRPSTAHP